MFSKSAEGDSLPATREAAAPGGKSHLSSDLKITGNVSSTGTIEVMGEVRGDIDTKTLTIGSGGKVAGKVRAESVDVHGELDGSTSCRQAVLRSSAVAKVQVTYETLVIESGAEVDGKFKYAGGKS